jgi:hypothetical protein
LHVSPVYVCSFTRSSVPPAIAALAHPQPVIEQQAEQQRVAPTYPLSKAVDHG